MSIVQASLQNGWFCLKLIQDVLLSGNFEESQGILEFKQKSGKSQGILKYQVKKF